MPDASHDSTPPESQLSALDRGQTGRHSVDRRVETRGRFAEWPRWAVAVVFALTVSVVGYGIIAPPMDGPHLDMVADSSKSDELLYKHITQRVQRGEGYYAAAIDEQRRIGYPLRPFYTVRSPILVTLTVAIGGLGTAQVLLQALSVLLAVLVFYRVARALDSPRLGATAAMLAAFALLFPSYQYVFHEAWAAMLAMLAILVRTDRRWVPSVLLGLAAALVRELAAPFLLVMLVTAWSERRRTEAVGWILAMLVGCAFYTHHAQVVMALTLPTDRVSRSWVSAGGWRFILRCVQNDTTFKLVPRLMTVVATPLALLGWLHWSHPIGRRAALYLVGFIGAFMVIGRPDNDYWGLLLAPLLPIGLAFVPEALQQGWQRIRGA